jgi:hypothetical protein
MKHKADLCSLPAVDTSTSNPLLAQGFFVHPCRLAALQYDPLYLYQLVATTLLTTYVIWPTLRRRPVPAGRRNAIITGMRLLYCAATITSAHLPRGLFRRFVVSILGPGGRWKRSASLAWCHAVLLQVGWPSAWELMQA